MPTTTNGLEEKRRLGAPGSAVDPDRKSNAERSLVASDANNALSLFEDDVGGFETEAV
jgi:hypothetical protein